MKLKLYRKYPKESYTIGKLYVIDDKGNELYVCDTLEDTVRDLNKNGVFDNGEKKIYGRTAIPYGTYNITMDVVSPKFSKYDFYKSICNGKLPRLLDVPHFEGILIHCAEGYKGAELLSGCIGVGKNTIKGGLTNSKETFRLLYILMALAHARGEKITIEVI